jgi:O-antigen ligase
MWNTQTPWFDVALAMTVFMLGHLAFGRFVEHESRGRRLRKSVVGVALLLLTSKWVGRTWMFVVLGALIVGVAVVHAWWLPRKGVNGWTAEPRDRYYALLKRDSTGKPLDSAR